MLHLGTPRLTLDPIELQDWEFLIELTSDPAWKRFIGDPQLTSREKAEAYIERGFLESYRLRGFGLLKVQTRKVPPEASQPIGICGLVQRDWLDDPDLGFAFLPSFRQQGYARESSQAVLEAVREQKLASEVLAISTPDNLASVALLAQLGFEDQGDVESPTQEILRLFRLDLESKSED